MSKQHTITLTTAQLYTLQDAMNTWTEAEYDGQKQGESENNAEYLASCQAIETLLSNAH